MPMIFNDGCVLRYLREIETNTPCVYGDVSSAVSVVLIGDSHAANWFPALNTIAISRHWRLVAFVKGSCSAASARVFLRAVGRPYDECVQWRERHLTKIQEMRPSVVIMASNDFDYGDLLGASGDSDQAWAEAWRASFAKVKNNEVRRVLISDTPRVQKNVLECLASHLGDFGVCNRRVGEVVVEPTRRRMIATAVARDGVQVIDPLPWFCAAHVCPAVVGNILVFRDNQHITPAYSMLLAPLLAGQLA
jgi:hypothetical protein